MDGACFCNPGWTGDKCQGKLKQITQEKFESKRCSNLKVLALQNLV